MNVKIKKLHKDAVVPSYSKQGDAGLDLVATDFFNDDYGNICYQTGLVIEIPEGYVGLLFPRSSISKLNMSLANSVGVIDSGYRGEVIVKFRDLMDSFGKSYKVGDRIAQLIIMPYPQIEFELVEELSETDRGEGGFGSSGE